MATVVLENLAKSCPEKNGPGVRVARGINLEIRDRELMVLVGPSGCAETYLHLDSGATTFIAHSLNSAERLTTNEH